MTSQEAAHERERLQRYTEMTGRRDRYNALLNLITRKDPDGPCGQGPFTGNTRESRMVEAITIEFSPTRGGAKRPANMRIADIDLSAFEFGSYLQAHLCKLIKKTSDEIDAL